MSSLQTVLDWLANARKGVELGDLPAWFALLVSAIALLLSWKAARYQRDGVSIAKESKEIAKESKEIAKRAQNFVEDRHAEEQVKAEEESRKVKWVIERASKSKLVLRNTTPNPATNVRIDEEKLGGIVRNLPNGVDVPGFGSLSFLLAGSLQRQPADEVWVEWDGSGGPVAVPIPPW